MQISDNESKKSVSSVAQSVEKGEISSSSSEWNLGSDKLFVTCIKDDSKNKTGKPINNYLNLFINTSLKHISIRSHLVRQPKNKLISIAYYFWCNFIFQNYAVKFQQILKLIR